MIPLQIIVLDKLDFFPIIGHGIPFIVFVVNRKNYNYFLNYILGRVLTKILFIYVVRT